MAAMDIRFEVNPQTPPSSKAILALYDAAGISFINWSVERMDRAMKHSSFVACAWHGNELVGFARGITDFAWSGWLSQIAVDPKFQKQRIGKRLLNMVTEYLGEEVSLLTHSADQATGFYEAMGFESYSNVYRKKRVR